MNSPLLHAAGTKDPDHGGRSTPRFERRHEGLRHESQPKERRDFGPQSHVSPKSPDLGLPHVPSLTVYFRPGSRMTGIGSRAWAGRAQIHTRDRLSIFKAFRETEGSF